MDNTNIISLYVFIRGKYRKFEYHNLHHYEGRKDVIIIFVLNTSNNIFNPFVEYIQEILHLKPNLNGPYSSLTEDKPNKFLPEGYLNMSEELIEDYNNNRMFYWLKFDQ